MTKSLVIVIIILGVITLYIYGYLKRRKSLLRLNSRNLLNDEEVYYLFYAESGFEKGEVIDSWNKVAKYLDIRPGLMRPTDRIGIDIGVDTHHIENKWVDNLSEFLDPIKQDCSLGMSAPCVITVNDCVMHLLLTSK
jgi:hypothetical protein